MDQANRDGLPRGALGWVRACLGGLLMGLANLVPGISGGTMLLATGVYTAFIESISDVTRLRLRLRPLLLLGAIAGTAALGILLLAGPTKTLVVERRWIMYSLFIGLTLGGVPLVWRMARPIGSGFLAGALAAFLVMVWMAFASPAGSCNPAGALPLLLLAGLAGAGAMILPGISGGYLLLLLGQYLPILAAIDQVKRGLFGAGGSPEPELILDAMGVLIPVAIGVAIGIAGVSNLIRWLLARYALATLGVLMGLLLGAVFGLWPFRAGDPPKPGDVVKCHVVTVETMNEIPPEDWNVTPFAPSGGQVAGALALLLGGLAFTVALDRFGSGRGRRPSAS